MKDASLNWIRLPLEHVENCRELGGYQTAYNQQTKWHTFIRSSDMSLLTQEDIKFLKDYGVRTVIDLRNTNEVLTYPNPLSEEAFCHYYNIPFIDDDVYEAVLSQLDRSLGDFYIDLLEQDYPIRQIFNTIAKADEGCIVFHCMAGKDRTGIIAMLLLGLAEVDTKDIASNYEVSYTNLESIHGREKLYEIIPKEVFYSNRYYILQAYHYILEKYQSVNQYLLDKGIKQDAIDQIKYQFIGVEEPVF